MADLKPHYRPETKAVRDFTGLVFTVALFLFLFCVMYPEVIKGASIYVTSSILFFLIFVHGYLMSYDNHSYLCTFGYESNVKNHMLFSLFSTFVTILYIVVYGTVFLTSESVDESRIFVAVLLGAWAVLASIIYFSVGFYLKNTLTPGWEASKI